MRISAARTTQSYAPCDDWRVTMGEARLASCGAVLAAADRAKAVRVEVTLGIQDGAHFEFGGLTVGGRDTVREFVTRTIHAEPEATSNQTVRAVHWGHGTGNFLGNIDVVRHAQKTDAAQETRACCCRKARA